MKKFAFILIISLYAPLASAADSVASSDCQQDAMTQADLNDCARQAFVNADKELNDVYKQILVEYRNEPLFLAKLKTSEELWIKLRQAEIEAMYPVTDSEKESGMIGSAHAMGVDFYAATLTRERTQHLRMWLDGEPEGDVSGSSIHVRK